MRVEVYIPFENKEWQFDSFGIFRINSFFRYSLPEDFHNDLDWWYYEFILTELLNPVGLTVAAVAVTTVAITEVIAPGTTEKVIKKYLRM